MRALTLTQPWCGLVASGIKLIENRPRSMIKREDFGKPFALHASREIDEAVYTRIRSLAPVLLDAPRHCDWYRLSRITSAIIGVATIERVIDVRCGSAGVDDDGHCTRCGLRVLLSDFRDGSRTECPPGFLDVTGDQRRWLFGPIGYVLRDVRALAEPVPCRGHQGFWTLPDDIAARVEAQL